MATQSGPENLKKSRQKKKLVKSNKSISRKNFAISKMAKNQFLNWEKFKTAKNAISEKKDKQTYLF